MLTSFKEKLQKTFNIEAKISLKSSIIVWDTDFCCFKSHCPSQNTSIRIQIQDSTAKKFKPKEFRSKDFKTANRKTPALFRTNELEKIFYQDKKKEYLKKKQDRKNSTPAIGDNAIESEKK